MKLPYESTAVWKFIWTIAWIIRPFFVRIKVEGVEQMPRHGGLVLACNHTRGPDYVILGYVSPRQIFYMAKAEIFYFSPLLTWLVAGLGTFPVRRGLGDSDAIEQAVRVVKRGKVLGMFPEGTRSRDGKLQRGKTGAARIALAAQAPVLPVVVIDSEPVLPEFFRLKRRPLVTVRFGAPFTMQGDPAKGEDVQAATNQIMLALADLLPPHRQGYYAAQEQVLPEEATT